MREPEKRMVDTKEASRLFCVAVGTLNNWRSKKFGPKYFKTGQSGRKILYKMEDLEEYFSSTPVLTLDSLPEAQR